MRSLYSFIITKKNAWLLFIMYSCTLFYVVFLTPNRYKGGTAAQPNLVPVVETVKQFYEQGNQHFWAYYIGYWGNIFGNIILFIPFGFLLHYLLPAKPRKTILLYGLFTSIGIELTQLFLQIGVCDIDDVILNVMGTATGIFLFTKAIKIIKKQTHY